jgi:hypothetical protein
MKKSKKKDKDLKKRIFVPLIYFYLFSLVFNLYLVGATGFEPATPCSQGRCANQAALRPD